MRGRIISVLGGLYIAFALLTAYSALDTSTESVQRNSDQRVQLDEAQSLIRDNQRLVIPNKEAFEIQVWTSRSCAPCQRFKKNEVPKLLEAELNVAIHDVNLKKPPKLVRFLPTIIVYKDGSVVKVFVGYTTAESIMHFMANCE